MCYVTMFSVSQCFVKLSIRGLHDGASSTFAGNLPDVGPTTLVVSSVSPSGLVRPSYQHMQHVRAAGYELLVKSKLEDLK